MTHLTAAERGKIEILLQQKYTNKDIALKLGRSPSAIGREVKEETNLDLDDMVLFIDSYYYGDSLGLHFAVFTKSNQVVCEPGVERA